MTVPHSLARWTIDARRTIDVTSGPDEHRQEYSAQQNTE
jgi:hypothetical protein